MVSIEKQGMKVAGINYAEGHAAEGSNNKHAKINTGPSKGSSDHFPTVFSSVLNHIPTFNASLLVYWPNEKRAQIGLSCIFDSSFSFCLHGSWHLS